MKFTEAKGECIFIVNQIVYGDTIYISYTKTLKSEHKGSALSEESNSLFREQARNRSDPRKIY